MLKKLVLTAATLATLATASIAMSGAARADDPWNWRHRHHQFSGHPGGYHGGPPPGTFLYDRFRGGGPFLWGGPGFYFGGPVYSDEPSYYGGPVYSRRCHVKRVKRDNHWVTRRVCHAY